MGVSLAMASLITSVVGTGVGLIGQQQQAAAARRQGKIRQQQFDLQQQQVRQRQELISQDIAREKSDERLRQRLLSQEGGQQRGRIRTAQAALGQLVDEGSAADVTSDLAGEVALRKLISQSDSDRRQRNFAIESGNLEAESGLLSLEASESRLGTRAASRAANINSFSTVLSTGSTLTRRFKIGDGGDLAFRT